MTGGWSTWIITSMDDCSVTCGKGIKKAVYARYCDSPNPSKDGTPCIGQKLKTNTESCSKTEPCPDDPKDIGKTLITIIVGFSFSSHKKYTSSTLQITAPLADRWLVLNLSL